ncbi:MULTISPECIES: PQQ-binding-like beta-propeller repeat protein [Catenuloplanes]|uniref:Outer membrane protein assembly factor BamB n=1 Tax=Catenuloplanes niger TaxID=587534 RepID=A0AAE4CRZ8_9ACTN|nr:PQQ-binding-like beta-propeller repeat protein [Catenuloplanes niger]MDR7320668.1 outer membrane protein assembly factor BamB [Catenuloplanes niger]
MRIRNALVVVGMLAGVAAAVPAQAAATPGGWPQTGYGPGHTGYNPSESVINARSVGGLTNRWTVRASLYPEGCEPVPEPPLVWDGRMFLLDSGSISGYDVVSGKKLWTYEATYFDGFGMAVSGGLVLGTERNCFSNSNYDTNVVAIDPRTGKEVWHQLQGYSIETSVADAGVFVVSGYCGVCDDEEHGVTAFRVSDGKPLWRQVSRALAGPVAANGKIVLRDPRNHRIEVVDIRTGDPLVGGVERRVAAASPAGDRFYLFDTAGIAAVDASTLTVRWTVARESGDLITDGRRVFVASANRINAYDANTGRLSWTRALADPSHLIRAGGLLYALSGRKLVILAPATGRSVVSAAAYGTVTDQVVVTGGRLFTTNGATVRAYTP